MPPNNSCAPSSKRSASQFTSTRTTVPAARWPLSWRPQRKKWTSPMQCWPRSPARPVSRTSIRWSRPCASLSVTPGCHLMPFKPRPITGSRSADITCFPKALQRRVLRGRKPIRGRPGASLPSADFDAARDKLQKEIHRGPNDQELLSYLLYPRVFPEFAMHQHQYSDTSVLPTPVFFYGMEPRKAVSVAIKQGKTLIIKFLTVVDPHPDGRRFVFFELNGQPRESLVEDQALGVPAQTRP